MKYAIIYSSHSGNTKILAQTIKESLKQEDCIYYGEPDKDALEADIIYVGFWTDKGTCDDSIQSFLQSLQNKKVFIFGTAGFGGGQEYFSRILNNVELNIHDSNTIINTFMCQGKMPISIKERYERMLPNEPIKMKQMIDNFDKASTHPDEKDLDKLIRSIKNSTER